VTRFDSSAIVYQLVYYLDDYPRIYDLQGEVLSRCWYAFRRRGIDMPFPVSDMNWRDADKVARRAWSRWVGLPHCCGGRVSRSAHDRAGRGTRRRR
jgi:small-conductance mechanosensitive channel